MIETQRCSGHCCKRFSLPFSWMEVQFFKKAIARGIPKINNPRSKWGGTWDLQSAEFKQVIDMLIPLSSHIEECQFVRRDKYSPMRRHPFDVRQHHYTCRYFDGVNCTIYENRPPMCRSYPSSGRCDYAGCTRKCESQPFSRSDLIGENAYEKHHSVAP